MRVLVKSFTDAALEKRDYSNCMEISIDEEYVFSVYDGEPEDANLSRDFNDCWSIPKLMKMAYDAGKLDDDFEITHVEVDEI